MITMAEALTAWRAGNDAGNGYAPDAADPEDDSIEGAVAAAVADGGEVVLRQTNTGEIAVLRMSGKLVGIGGDGSGRGAWAVDLEEGPISPN